MDVTEVRVRLVRSENQEKLRAFASLTFDDEFVIRDLKVIDGNNGLFVAMPSRKATDRCPKCSVKNVVRASYCNNCGKRLPEVQRTENPDERPKTHVDIAHPITQRCRESIHQIVIQTYEEELAVRASRENES